MIDGLHPVRVPSTRRPRCDLVRRATPSGPPPKVKVTFRPTRTAFLLALLPVANGSPAASVTLGVPQAPLVVDVAFAIDSPAGTRS
jgi:hypothetical protein